jgi:rhodanese-related sulfurtransferase
MGQLAEFASNHPFLVLGVFVSLLGVVFYELRLGAQGTTQLSASDAVRLINKGATVVDVRSPADYCSGHIVNARNVPLKELEADAGVVNKTKTRALLTVCDNGSSSGKAAQILRKAGYETVFSLKGGISSWRAESLPLVK